MDDLSALMLQIAYGADEALDDQPIDRLVLRAPRPQQSASLPETPAPRPAARAPEIPAQLRAQTLADQARTLEELRQAMESFDGCALSTTATQLVFADGNPDSGLMLIGEAPGAEEDRMGKPFVGPSGQFLDRMLASIGLDRTNFLITNIVPWRPPGNRNPTDSEILLCRPFLMRHIALVRPQRLVLLGGIAAQSLLGSKSGITRLRGRWATVDVPGLAAPIPALAMLHPAYLLRNPGAKREMWQDLVALRQALEQ